MKRPYILLVSLLAIFTLVGITLALKTKRVTVQGDRLSPAFAATNARAAAIQRGEFAELALMEGRQLLKDGFYRQLVGGAGLVGEADRAELLSVFGDTLDHLANPTLSGYTNLFRGLSASTHGPRFKSFAAYWKTNAPTSASIGTLPGVWDLLYKSGEATKTPNLLIAAKTDSIVVSVSRFSTEEQISSAAAAAAGSQLQVSYVGALNDYYDKNSLVQAGLRLTNTMLLATVRMDTKIATPQADHPAGPIVITFLRATNPDRWIPYDLMSSHQRRFVPLL
jgi:hypothetical protein